MKRITRKMWMLLLPLVAALGAWAQGGTIKGRVLVQNAPKEGASVFIPSTGKGTQTDREGTFELRNITPGNYQLAVSLLGYKPLLRQVAVNAAELLELSFELEEDPLQLEQVVVTGTRSAVPRYNAPVVVSTITPKTFEATQSLSLADGLNFSPGLRLENNCQNCGFTQLRMNGLGGPYSQILINSRPVFSALAGVYGLDMLPANMVERVEVVRGGGSVLYGGNAIAGTVNVITRDPLLNTMEVGLNQAFTNGTAPDRTLTLNGTVVSHHGDKGISFYGYNRSREPWDANGDGFSELTKLRNNTFGFDAFWNTTDRSKLRLGAYAISEFRRGGNRFDLAPHQTDITEQVDHKIIGTNFSYEQYSANRKHKFTTYASAQFVRRDSYYGGGGRVLQPGDSLTEADVLAINAYGTSVDKSIVVGQQYTADLRPNAQLTAGAEYIYNDVTDAMPGYGRSIVQQVGTLGTFAQLDWKPAERWNVLAGLRYDRVGIDGNYDFKEEKFANDRQLGIMVPRLSVLYKITDALKARASFAQGYRAPQAFDEDLHIETVGGAAKFIRLSPDLEMERSNSYTASLNYGKTINGRQYSFLAEGFFTRLNNPFILSDQTELPSGVAVITKRNGEGASVYGVNLEGNIAFSRKLILQTGATLQRAVYDEEEVIWEPEPGDNLPVAATTRILRTPNAYGYGTLQYNPTERWALAYSGVVTGSMVVPHIIDPDNEQTVIKSTPSFFEHNLRVSYTLPFGDDLSMQLFGGVQNMFNAFQRDFDVGPLRDAGYIYGPARPRTLFIGFKMNIR